MRSVFTLARFSSASIRSVDELIPFKKRRVLGFEILLGVKASEPRSRPSACGSSPSGCGELLDEHRNVVSGFVLQRFDTPYGLFGRRIFVFAVQAVEELEVHADADRPARQHLGYLIVVKRHAAHGHHLRQERRTLRAYPFVGQPAFLVDLIEQRVAFGGQCPEMVERFDAFEYEHRRDGLVVVCLAYGAVSGAAAIVSTCDCAFCRSRSASDILNST